jgi:hypothetical protein
MVETVAPPMFPLLIDVITCLPPLPSDAASREFWLCGRHMFVFRREEKR